MTDPEFGTFHAANTTSFVSIKPLIPTHNNSDCFTNLEKTHTVPHTCACEARLSGDVVEHEAVDRHCDRPPDVSE